MHRTENNTRVQKNHKDDGSHLLQVSDHNGTSLQVVEEEESSQAFPELGALWTNRTGLGGTPSASVSVCACRAQCVTYCAAAPAGPGIQ